MSDWITKIPTQEGWYWVLISEVPVIGLWQNGAWWFYTHDKIRPEQVKAIIGPLLVPPLPEVEG